MKVLKQGDNMIYKFTCPVCHCEYIEEAKECYLERTETSSIPVAQCYCICCGNNNSSITLWKDES